MACSLRRRGSSLINRKHNNTLPQSINLILELLQAVRDHANGKIAYDLLIRAGFALGK